VDKLSKVDIVISSNFSVHIRRLELVFSCGKVEDLRPRTCFQVMNFLKISTCPANIRYNIENKENLILYRFQSFHMSCICYGR